MIKKISVYLQYLAPQHWLTHIAGWLAENRTPWFKNFFIKKFIKKYNVDMSLAKIENPEAFVCFNQFFIREFKPELRPVTAGANEIACPADGTIAQIGRIQKAKMLQAKNFYFTLDALLGGDLQLAETFQNGDFATIYLAPSNYHRVHMPITGKLIKTIFVPGNLFSVNNITAESVPNLYSRNERLICLFETAAGPMAVILVGAMIVGSIQTVWMKEPVREKHIHIETCTAKNYVLAKGAELGHFKLGSTVLVLFSKDKTVWTNGLGADTVVNFGQLIGNFNE